jgi:hypothetical protein
MVIIAAIAIVIIVILRHEPHGRWIHVEHLDVCAMRVNQPMEMHVCL